MTRTTYAVIACAVVMTTSPAFPEEKNDQMKDCPYHDQHIAASVSDATAVASAVPASSPYEGSGPRRSRVNVTEVG